MANVFLCTAALWIINNILVLPLSQYCSQQKLASMGLANCNEGEALARDRETIRRVTTNYYMVTDVAVLGTLGLVTGLMGFFFIGFATQGKAWPGMLTFIAASFLGFSIANPAGLSRAF